MLQADAAQMSAEGPIGGLYDFATLNWLGSTWDYKSRANPSAGGREFYFFGDQLVGADTYGNYHYGYVGTAGGYSPSVLQYGAGAAQVIKQLWNLIIGKGAAFYSENSYFNNPTNPPKIQYGIDTYNSSFANDAANFSSPNIQTRAAAVNSFNSGSGATSNESKLWTTPNGAVITWGGGVVSPGIKK
jgi:hypothetical protein